MAKFIMNERSKGMKDSKLTDEELIKISNVYNYVDLGTTQRVARELIEERKQPKVWDGAPEWAKHGQVHFYDGLGNNSYSSPFARELPKTKERTLAEETIRKIEDRVPTKETMIDTLESMLLEYAKDNGSNT